MSSTKETRLNLPREGETLSSAQVSNYDLTTDLAAALHRAVGHFKKPCAVIAERTGRSRAAAKRWLAGDNAPGAQELIELMREFREVRDLVLSRARCSPAELTDGQLQAVEEALRVIARRGR